MSNPKKDKAIAVVGTILVHAMVLLVLFLIYLNNEFAILNRFRKKQKVSEE